MSGSPAGRPVLAIDRLRLTAGGIALAEDVSLTIGAGEMVGLVGESGSGKSITALAVLRLLPEHQIAIAGGRLLFEGEDILRAPPATLRTLRGGRIGMIFQEPMTALNPVLAIGEQVAEPLIIHRGMKRGAALARAAELLDLVGIPGPKAALSRYPHQLSGGQRQRVGIAIAIACEPKLLIADEPTTALDVTVQAQVLGLIAKLRRELGLACLLITHDLGVIAETCERAYVMYAGRIVETGSVQALFSAPVHRYTRALLETIPARNPPGRLLPAIPGQVPPPGRRGRGCGFASRCAARIARCAEEMPPLGGDDGHYFACWNPAP